MWTKAEEVPKEDADKVLERWDQTAPDVQRMIALQYVLNIQLLRAANAEMLAVLAKADSLLSDAYDYMDSEGADFNGPTMDGIREIGPRIAAALAKAREINQ